MSTQQFAHILLPASNPEGKPVLSVIAKAAFTFAPDGKTAWSAEPPELVKADKFYDPGDPLVNACEEETNLIPWKPLSDIVVIGKAWAPRRREVVRMGVSVSVGKHRKDLVVTGDRVCHWKPLAGPLFGEAKPFVEMDLRYERAYGGVDLSTNDGQTPLMYARNPIGKGFVVKKKKELMDGMALPNIEDPNMLLTQEGIAAGEIAEWHRMPMPAGFGVFGKAWYPRCSFAGVMPADMPLYTQIYEMAAGLVPKDQVELFKSLKMPMMDFHFFNGASPGLAVPYLQGDEAVRIEGMSADGLIQFQLPGGKPAITIDFGEGARTPEVVVHTVVIRTEQRLATITWRGACEYPGPQYADKLTKLDVKVEPA